MEKIKLSIVVPCYNEGESLRTLIKRFLKVRVDKSELILVNNGSYDSTDKIIKKYTDVYDYIRCVTIKDNIGYGNGIYQGLKVARGEYLSYTHADLQTDINDCIRGYFKLRNQKYVSYIKGQRSGRKLLDRFFTYGMSIFCSMTLGKYMFDINAQPNIFPKYFLVHVKNPPKDFSFDLYMYYIALHKMYDVKRLDVNFSERQYGESHWNNSLINKYKFIKRTVLFTMKLRRQLKNDKSCS